MRAIYHTVGGAAVIIQKKIRIGTIIDKKTVNHSTTGYMVLGVFIIEWRDTTIKTFVTQWITSRCGYEVKRRQIINISVDCFLLEQIGCKAGPGKKQPAYEPA